LGPRPEQSGQNIARTPSFTVETRNYKHQGITKRTIFLRIFVKAAMNIDFISSMKVEELKDFLKLRGLKVSGRKVELVARVFAASENNVPLVKTAVEVVSELAKKYAKKLLVDDKHSRSI